MARMFGAGSKDAERYFALPSKFQKAVYEAAFLGSSAALEKLLLSEYPMTPEDRTMLADYSAGRLKRGRGRPTGKIPIRIDWLGTGGRIYFLTKLRWDRMGARKKNKDKRGYRLKFKRRDGNWVTIRPELCRRIAARLGHANKAVMLEDYVKRAQSRR